MKTPRIYNRFSLFWNTVALGLFFWVPSLIWYDELIIPVKTATYSTSLVVMIIVFATWIPSAIQIYWRNQTDGPALLMLAVFLVAFVFLQSAVIRYLNLQLGQPAWVFDSPIGAFISYQIAMLGILITVAVAKTSGVDLEDFRRKIGWGLFIAGLIAGVFLGAFFGKIQ